jgi:hypothetical protein
MAPLHVKRKFWWELIFIGVLIFLLTGVHAQRKRDVAAAAQPTLVPVIVALAPAVKLGLVVAPLSPTLASQ